MTTVDKSADCRICVGQFGAPHGVRGLVRLRSFTENPDDIMRYPLTDETGRAHYKLDLKSKVRGQFIASVAGVNSREAAEALRNRNLFTSRGALPGTPKGAYYQSDLLGLTAMDQHGHNYGKVLAVHNYGGGPLLEIGHHARTSFMLPFTDACVPEVSPQAGTLIIAMPEGWLDPVEKKAKRGKKDQGHRETSGPIMQNGDKD